jgi:hypothetical protein
MMGAPGFRAALRLFCVLGTTGLAEGIPAARADELCDQIARLDRLAVGNFAEIRGPVVNKRRSRIYFRTAERLPGSTECDLYRKEDGERLTFACLWKGSKEDVTAFGARVGQCLNSAVEWRNEQVAGDLAAYFRTTGTFFDIDYWDWDEGGEYTLSVWDPKIEN